MIKFKQFLWVMFAVSVFVGFSLFLGFTGAENLDYNYVKIEVNPKVEFISDTKNNVTSVYALNDEAKQLLVGEDFIGLKIEKATKKFVDLCVQANYIDVERKDNAVKLTVVAGLTQALETNVYKEVSEYFRKNAIHSVIVENQKDLKQFKEAKKLGVSVNKLSLMEAVTKFEPNLTLEQAKKLSEKELVSRLHNAHQNLEQHKTFTNSDIQNKTKLIDFNRAKLNKHKESLTNNKISEFADDYKLYVKETLKKYEIDFDKQNEEWERSRENSYYA